jgi:transcriptional regulator GlxA family with amidase domain
MSLNIAIYLYDEVEVLDFAGPFEVFSTASRVRSRITPDLTKPFGVFTVAARSGTIRARGGLVIQPAYRFGDHPAIDVLIVPGGIIDAELERGAVIAWIGQQAQQARLTASVCTGAFLLAKAGLLRGKAATTHWEDIPALQAMFPEVNVLPGRRWVEAGEIITSAGISAGIDLSLRLVARLESEQLAIQTARQMEYRWEPGPAG